MSSPMPPVPASYTTVCWSCSSTITSLAEVCPRCGVRQQFVRAGSEKRILPAALLAFLFGIFGAHRFYAGRPLSAVLQLLTLGGLGIWALIDFILVICGEFRDAEGHKITRWT